MEIANLTDDALFDCRDLFMKIFIYYFFFFSCASIRENTIASMRYAATHGADMIEFDVQLTKDLVPVIYHDFYVSLAMKKKLNKGIDEHDLLQLPVKDLTMAQLQMLKV